MKPIAVIFPGAGYTKDRPLLYYAGKLAIAAGYELIHVDFSGFKWSKEQLKDPDFLMDMLSLCMNRTDEALRGISLQETDSILFISKSIGTVAATAYAKQYSLPARQLLFTPLADIGRYVKDGNGLVFYGNADPFADPDEIAKFCETHRLKAHCIEHANHSLETGRVTEDLANLQSIMRQVEEYLC